MLKKSRLKPVLAGAAIAALAMTAAGPVYAAMQGPSDSGFYTPPTMSGGDKGELIWYRQATADLGADAPAISAWNVMYHSRDALGSPNIVTGTVLVPGESWNGSGERPVVNYAVGTHGMADNCAPSKQIAQGTDYESANLSAALKRGYAVLVTDNPGYTTGDRPTYLSAKAQGHAILDMFDAATQIPDAGISNDAPTALWGFSQGGQTAAMAGEIQPDYAPDLNLKGIASGGTPADFHTTALNLNQSTGAAFLLQGVVGLAEQYPDGIPLDQLVNAQGQQEIDRVLNQDVCVFETLFDYMNDDIADYTVNNTPLEKLLQEPSIDETLDKQFLGTKKSPVPTYLYHGTADEFIPLEQSLELKKRYCNKFSNVTYGVYPSEHIVTQFQAAPHVLDWLGERFEDQLTFGTCLTTKPKPEANPNPGGGNFVVSLDEWPLDASIDLATLDQTVVLPEEASFTADTDMTAGTLNGNLSIPDFSTELNILLPLDVELTVEPAGPTTGTASLDNQGILNVSGDASTYITVNSAGFGWLQIPFGCKTEAPVDFPLDFNGPVSSLGNGSLTFTGTTSFPDMSGCGLFTGLFTTLMSGPGQEYTFTVAPPAPTTW